MSVVKQALLSATAAIIIAFVCGAKLPGQVDPNCLGCLCEASTNCNTTAGCHVPFPGAYFCGPFLISWAYWADAGKPVIQNDNADRKGAFENCVNDLYCAAQTVRNYMEKHSKGGRGITPDCNGDGRIDCYDYVYMHRFGAYDCQQPSFPTTDYYRSFDACMNVVQAATPLRVDVRAEVPASLPAPAVAEAPSAAAVLPIGLVLPSEPVLVAVSSSAETPESSETTLLAVPSVEIVPPVAAVPHIIVVSEVAAPADVTINTVAADPVS